MKRAFLKVGNTRQEAGECKQANSIITQKKKLRHVLKTRRSFHSVPLPFVSLMPGVNDEKLSDRTSEAGRRAVAEVGVRSRAVRLAHPQTQVVSAD